jgi:Barrel-sandwich domain of CusB or HlyD membrane-fusion
MKKRLLIPLIIIGTIVAFILIYSISSEKSTEIKLTSTVTKGKFEIIVAVTGELQAERSVEIKGPDLRSRNLRIRAVKIMNLIPEGTLVDSGDWVATLDRSEADNSLKDVLDELERTESQYTTKKIDTTIQLRNLRDDLINQKFNMEEMKIALEQSKYEPPATIRQAKINLDKTERAYEQALNTYKLKEEQAKADMTVVTISLARIKRAKEEMEELLNNFDIYAKSSGMVIYKKEWGGQKRSVGSEVDSWDLAVATLPDLSSLVSQTYVNEIDISKVKVKQQVKVGVDAFPEKSLSGEVISVANIGEQLPNTDAKVFEVTIRINERDTILRPSMTTSNQIVTQVFDDVLYIPIEAVHSNDSLSYVFTLKNTKQVVMLGESNENFIIVEDGLNEGEEIYLSIPENYENFKWTGLELMEKIKQKQQQEQLEEKQETKPQERSGNAPYGLKNQSHRGQKE